MRGRIPMGGARAPGRDMLGVSGIVPDGVSATYLTAPDGTAVRADVVDNGYAFVVPTARRAQARYVVWTGADGTPHVQPVPPVVAARRGGCPKVVLKLTRVTPEGPGCSAPLVVSPRPRRVPAPPALPRRVVAPPAAPIEVVYACPAVPPPVPATRPPRRP